MKSNTNENATPRNAELENAINEAGEILKDIASLATNHYYTKRKVSIIPPLEQKDLVVKPENKGVDLL